MIDDELDWLVLERPTRALTHTSTARARMALLDHIEASAKPLAPVVGPIRRRRPGRRSSVLALTGIAAAAAVALLASGAFSGGSHVLGTQAASAAPLARLSARVSQSPSPTGDATLVLRRHQLADGHEFTGADLYTDDGRYFYAATRAELPATIKANDLQDDGSIQRELAAAVAALDAPLATARETMANAAFDPNADMGALIAQGEKTAAAKIAALKAAGIAPVVHHLTPEQHTDGMIWTNCLDALIAGAGRPNVRAGVLRLLSTIDAVSVEHTTTDGRATLDIRSHTFPDGYEERLIIDADTGMPIRFIGSDPGQSPPSVVVDYQVTRVTTADIENG
jgi:hypothetical protein